MRRSSFLLLALAFVLGCGGGSSSSSGGSTTAAGGAPVGNAAVQARLVSVPAPPVPWSTTFAGITVEQATALCPWVDVNVSPAPMEEHCPDGSTVRAPGPPCTPADMAGMGAQLGETGCTMSIGEFFACNLALRASPCSGGMLGMDHPECEAKSACIRAAFQAASAQQSTAPAESAPADGETTQAQ